MLWLRLDGSLTGREEAKEVKERKESINKLANTLITENNIETVFVWSLSGCFENVGGALFDSIRGPTSVRIQRCRNGCP